MDVGLPDDMWSPYKQFYRVIEQTVANPSGTSIGELEHNLKKYKQHLSNILRNPPKNEAHRNQLKNGLSEGINLTGHNRTIVLSKDLVDECIILSDMFDLDEFCAIELLCTAQRSMPQYPGIPRGLVAILLYYDGRKAIACALRDLFQMTNGVAWVADVPNELIMLITAYTKNLVEDTNILERIINLIDELDIVKETELLTKNRAFGPRKHQSQVLELFKDIRMALATALFNWSAQNGLTKPLIVRLIENLSKIKINDSMDDISITLLMTILYTFDTNVLRSHEDTDALVQNLCAMNEPDFLQSISDAFFLNIDAECNFLNVAKFGFGLYLASLRQAPQSIQNALSKIIESDEKLIDQAIDSRVFETIYSVVLQKEFIFKNEFFYRRMHTLLTDFIDYMHSKVNELRGKAEETARTVMHFMKEGLEPPPNLDHSFKYLMLSIGRLYKNDPAGLSLCVEYWGPLDGISTATKLTTRSVSLFKFLRLSGELLPSSLFVPYLKMIAGLTSCERSARNAYNLLKQTSKIAVSATLSWDHFFATLGRYYSNMRQEQWNPSYEARYRNRSFNRSINPIEIEGLHAVLEIIRTVANYDEVARIALCEQPTWAPLHTLLGLVCCSVPLPLKADLLNTLAALSKSKETALPLWNNIENAQIITTIPSTASYNSCNLEMEIDLNECRFESYPVTLGVLNLLKSLFETVIPKYLGADTRKPGLEPYTKFIINSIFLKFYNRSFKDPKEKWLIAKNATNLIYYLLTTYTINVGDFDENNVEQPHPGFYILLQLHTKSDLLRLILTIINDCREILDEYVKFDGKTELEETALYSLHIIEYALDVQDKFFAAYSDANSSIMLSGLNRIILDINPRTHKPDHILNTTKFITYSNWLPTHALLSVKILNKVARAPPIATQLLGIFSMDNSLQIEIRQGFIECLENDIPLNDIPDINDNNIDVVIGDNLNMDEDLLSILSSPATVSSSAKTEILIKEAIIELLRNSLKHPAPNLAHYLLGFDTTRDFDNFINRKQSSLETNNVSNCTKSIVYMLDNHLEMKKYTNTYDKNIEKVIQHTYHLLYLMCFNQRTSETVFRYLRSCNDFLVRHVRALPFIHADSSYILNQMSFLLKCTAIELKIVAAKSQISRYQHLCELLVSTSLRVNADSISLELNHYYSFATHMYSESTMVKKPSDISSNLLLCNLLNTIDFEAKYTHLPKWDYFDNSMTERIFDECELIHGNGLKLVDLRKLYNILTTEVRTIQNNIATGQRKLILMEIQAIMRFTMDINYERTKSHATSRMFESWSQVVGVLFSCAPKPSLSIISQQELILEVLQKILSKVLPVQSNHEISLSVSSNILSLLINLRYTFIKKNALNDDNNFHVETDNEKLTLLTAKSHSLSLKHILKDILEWMLLCGATTQKLRINLYVALLNLLKIVSNEDEENYNDKKDNDGDNNNIDNDNDNDDNIDDENEDVNDKDNKDINDDEYYVSRLDRTSSRKSRNLGTIGDVRAAIEVFLSFGEKLFDLISNDCISGHDICKMTALSFVDSLLELDPLTSFINYIANHGYLMHIVENLSQTDDKLCRILRNTPENIKSLYVYESQMAMLLRLAMSHLGAELLLVNKIMNVLSSMRVFSMHPDFHASVLEELQDSDEYIPSIEQRYRQILFPALHLCSTLLTTLGTSNRSVLSQVQGFIIAHSDMIEVILRAGTPSMNLGLLKEMSAITNIIARITNHETFNIIDKNDMNMDNVNLYRIQRLMLGCLTRFTICDNTIKQILRNDKNTFEMNDKNDDDFDKDNWENIQCFLEIVANLSVYCCNAIACHGGEHKQNGILFSPCVTENAQRKENGNITLLPPQEIGIVINQLKGAVEYYHVQMNAVKSRRLKMIKSNKNNGSFKATDAADLSEDRLNLLTLCSLITDQCLYLLWSHLDFYMRRVIANEAFGRSEKTYLNDNPEGLVISFDEICTLKKVLISTFNETFCKQLLQTSGSKADFDKNFTNALLRRIKALIQFVPAN